MGMGALPSELMCVSLVGLWGHFTYFFTVCDIDFPPLMGLYMEPWYIPSVYQCWTSHTLLEEVTCIWCIGLYCNEAASFILCMQHMLKWVKLTWLTALKTKLDSLLFKALRQLTCHLDLWQGFVLCVHWCALFVLWEEPSCLMNIKWHTPLWMAIVVASIPNWEPLFSVSALEA